MLELQIMMQWDLKHVLLIVHKDKSKKENKLFIQLLFIKLMLLTPVHKDFWPCFLELQDKLHNKSENKLIKKLLNGENKEKQK